MATQATIYSCENSVRDAVSAINTATECLRVEQELQGTIYPENEPAWVELENQIQILKGSIQAFQERFFSQEND